MRQIFRGEHTTKKGLCFSLSFSGRSFIEELLEFRVNIEIKPIQHVEIKVTFSH